MPALNKPCENYSHATNILIVDDEAIMRTLLTDILQDEGYNVSSLPCAEDALEVITKGNTDLVITDIKMKGMTGIDLLKKTKEVSPSTEVIIVTGYATPETTVESIRLGAIDCLSKPVNINRIKTLVNDIDRQNQSTSPPN